MLLEMGRKCFRGLFAMFSFHVKCALFSQSSGSLKRFWHRKRGVCDRTMEIILCPKVLSGL